jgi:LCP family protein required for cell wall assembly
VRIRSSRRRRLIRPATAALLLLSLVFSAGIGALAYYMPVATAMLAATGHASDLPSAAPSAPGATATPAPAPNAPFTVLLLGSDNDEKFDPNHVLTQSMILVRVDPGAKQVTMLSIPRDLYVNFYLARGAGKIDEGKIDEVYSYGGPSASIATVERNFQVKIDQYVWIGLKGLIRVIDLMGGVDLITTKPVLEDEYPADIDTQDPYGYHRVAVLPGPQHLDGAHALQYVRSRHGDRFGDFARSQRQQQVLTALRGRASLVGPADLPDLAKAIGGEMRTSMSVQQVAQLLPLMVSLKPENIRQIVLLGNYTSESLQGTYYLYPNWELIRPLVRQTFPG